MHPRVVSSRIKSSASGVIYASARLRPPRVSVKQSRTLPHNRVSECFNVSF